MPKIANSSTEFAMVTGGGANILSTAKAKFANGLWLIKSRDSNDQYRLVDSVRGDTKQVQFGSPSSEASAEQPYTPSPSGNCISYCWNTPASGINTNAGFSITKGTGNVPHGLGVKPEFVLIKDLTKTQNIRAYHKDVPTDMFRFDASAPDAGTWTIDTTNTGLAQITGDAIRYSWVSVDGYSKVGSFIGSPDHFEYLGFRPAFVIIKNSQASSLQWYWRSSVANPHNPTTTQTQGGMTDWVGEKSFSNEEIDWLANGFKCRTQAGHLNYHGQRMIYIAFAEHPFKYANAR